MRLSSILSVFLPVAATFAAPATNLPIVKVTYDRVYDGRDNSLSIVACSNGPNGLLTKGYTNFGSLGNFPVMGGTQYVAGWNSPNCGTCWQLGFNGRTINVLAIDHADEGFNVSFETLQRLTLNQTDNLGGVLYTTVQQVSTSLCRI
ncbi:hypothetical protein NLI96_g2748 [Meripilus lineatus]|uniref:Cerato-platanin n=1 Tax=Meripilus lineatus TaxID=2056292 RepID=A0AAD5VDK8_9APHY|nr:hypothetical protein NLI96_g2748 [Physisporinus lineatus]